jgi:methionyl-tRNA formyltransferase
MTRVAFLGTPGAAVPSLLALAASHEVAIVITQPDRPKGRSGTPAPPPVKGAAQGLGLLVAQPSSRAQVAEVLNSVADLELAVVVAYGRILDVPALEAPARGMLNVHFSLLPRWRGAAPVARALLAGDSMTGVTIIRLDEGLDTGPVLTAQAVDIGPDETAGELTGRLASLGARLLVDMIPGYLAGEVVPVKQTDQDATYATKLEPSERPLEVHRGAGEAVRKTRALSPEPGATLDIDGTGHQILRARLSHKAPATGTWVEDDRVPVVGFADGGVEIVEILPPGKRPMSGSAWLAGRQVRTGTVA